MISCRKLTRRFGDLTAVDNLNFEIDTGAVCAFLGPNGAGKSTTVKMLTGLLPPSSGDVEVCGLNVRLQATELKRRIGVLPEDLGLFDDLTVEEHLSLTGSVYGLDKHVARSRIDQLLHALSLEHGRHTFAAACSHGMRKKTSFAMALLPNPQVLFLDEPFEAIDPVTSKIMRDLLQSIASRGVTVFFTSHVLSAVEQIATQLIMIRKGKIVWNSPAGGSARAARTALLRSGGNARGGGHRMARVTAILKALGRALGRDQKSIASLTGNHFFIVSALVLQDAGGFIYLIMGLVILFPLSTDPMRKIPASRMSLWPIERRERWVLRAVSPWINPVTWAIAALAVWTARGKVTVGLWALVAGVVASGFVLSSLPIAWNFGTFLRVPNFPGPLNQLVRKNLRAMFSTLDFYCALLLSASVLGFRLALPALPRDAFPVITILVVAGLSSYAQCLFGLDGKGRAVALIAFFRWRAGRCWRPRMRRFCWSRSR